MSSDIKTQSIPKDHGFGKDPREKLSVLMPSIQHLLIYNKCNHMLNIADLNIYLYQKNEIIGCWLHARISKGCYPCQNAVNNIRNMRKSKKLHNLSKSRLKCLWAPNSPYRTKCNPLLVDFLEHSTKHSTHLR